MDDYYQYRIIVNDCEGEVGNASVMDRWESIAASIEERGYTAELQRRLVTNISILPMLSNPDGYKSIGKMVICPWETWAMLNQ